MGDIGLHVTREIFTLKKNLSKISDGQAEVVRWKSDNINEFILTILPNDGPYHDETYEFEFILPSRYPDVSPTITCLTPINHPHIENGRHPSFKHNVCIPMLGYYSDWTSNLRLEECVQGLLHLLHHPNFDGSSVIWQERHLVDLPSKSDNANSKTGVLKEPNISHTQNRIHLCFVKLLRRLKTSIEGRQRFRNEHLYT